MKKIFSKHWKSSKQPRKQRKYLAKAPLHIKRRQLSVNLSKELRENQKKRNVELRKGDKVKIMRGKYKGKTGKVNEIKTKRLKIYIDGIQVKKLDGSKTNVPIRPSNLQIIELNKGDKKRFKKKIKSKEDVPLKEAKTSKKENKPVKEEENKNIEMPY